MLFNKRGKDKTGDAGAVAAAASPNGKADTQPSTSAAKASIPVVTPHVADIPKSGAKSTMQADASSAIGQTPANTQGNSVSPNAEEASRRIATALGDIVSVLMRSPRYRTQTLADLEWMVAPAIAAGQFALAHAKAKSNGALIPMAFVTWARVSVDVDKILSASPDTSVRLQPEDWQSGDIVWIIDATGEERVLKGLLGRLVKTVGGDQLIKMRGRNKDGNAAVLSFGAASPGHESVKADAG